MGEVGQDVVSAAVQGPAELGEFLQAGGQPVRSRSIRVASRVLPRWGSFWA